MLQVLADSGHQMHSNPVSGRSEGRVIDCLARCLLQLLPLLPAETSLQEFFRGGGLSILVGAVLSLLKRFAIEWKQLRLQGQEVAKGGGANYPKSEGANQVPVAI